MKNNKPKRRVKNGLYSLAICAAMLAAVIGFNLLISVIPDSSVKIDTTSEGLFTFSEQTNTIVKELDKDVEMYLIVEPGEEDDYVVNMLDRYEQMSEHIKVTHVNPLINPMFTSAYTDETVENNGVIVASGDKSVLVRKTDMYSYGFDYTYYTNATVFEGETKLTGAIKNVASDDIKTIAVITGHGEQELYEGFADAVTDEGFELESAELSDIAIDNADAVLINSPAADITAEEAEILSNYLDNGGKLMLISGFVDGGFDNIYSVMGSFGMEAVSGIIIEGNESNSISGYPYYLLPNIEEHKITEPIISSSEKILMPVSMGIKETDGHRSTLTVESLLNTSDDAYLKTDPYGTESFEFEEGDIKGGFSVGMIAEEEFAGNTIRVSWYSSDMMASEYADTTTSGSNIDMLANTLEWMCGRESGISVRAKSTVTPYLTVTTSFKSVMTVVICALIPALLLAAGTVIVIRRRRRK